MTEKQIQYRIERINTQISTSEQKLAELKTVRRNLQQDLRTARKGTRTKVSV